MSLPVATSWDFGRDVLAITMAIVGNGSEAERKSHFPLLLVRPINGASCVSYEGPRGEIQRQPAQIVVATSVTNHWYAIMDI